MANKTQITFEDRGQDFLRWTIEADGRITACDPFQFSIWSKWKVLNKDFKVGGYVAIEKDGDETVIKYPIEEIKILEDGKTDI